MQKKLDGQNHHTNDKSKGQKDKLVGTKEGKELVAFMVGIYFTHNPFNVTYMQIVISNSGRRYKTNNSCQCNFSLYSKG
jgi:hypothetical protein